MNIPSHSTFRRPNFPERLGQLVIVPVPWIAKGLWATVSMLLDEVTASKVVVRYMPLPAPATLAHCPQPQTWWA